MPRSSLILGIGFLSFAGCLVSTYVPSVKGSGTKTTETKPIAEFHELSGSGVGTYKVTSGKPASLKITTDDNLQPYIQAALDPKKEQLHIGIKSGSFDWTFTPEMEVETGELTSVALQGRVTLEAREINAKQFTVKLEGETNVSLLGTADELTVRIDGKSNFNASGLKCKKVKIICNGMCTASIHGTEAVEVDANGMCTVDVLGKPAKKDLKANGMSKVNEK